MVEIVVGVAVVIGVLTFLWWAPEWQGRRLPDDVAMKDRASLVNEYRRTLAQIIGGVVLLAGLYFTGQQFQLTGKQFELAESGQITERFSNAVAQLGEPGPTNTAVRIGGIYALERLARDSPTDHSTIVEILAAFVRAPRPAISGDDHPGAPADVQAALNVLGRRERREEQGRLDLRNSALGGANLTRGRLSFADLTGADLSGANIDDAQLDDAYLSGARLDGARLANANLTNATLTRASVTNRADLTGAKLIDARLTNADFTDADLTDADLTGADISGADFTGAMLLPEQVKGCVQDNRTRFPWPTPAK